LSVTKVTWQQVGHVSEPGRYMFRFGWLTMTPEDLDVWTRFPDATFTLVKMTGPDVADEENDEYHLGVFELTRAPVPTRTGPVL
jgi:hypothetical protein